ncbi:MAG: hypothetical protein KC620_04330 [Myxococcales bacterium]|nr:hypothetical protein [Myxococcales bacterium]
MPCSIRRLSALLSMAVPLLLLACDDDDPAADPIDARVRVDQAETPDPRPPIDATPPADAGPVEDAAPMAPDPALVARPSSCGAPVTARFDAEGGAAQIGDGALIDAAFVLPADALTGAIDLTLDCADDIVAEGHVPLGPALRVAAAAPQPLLKPGRVTLVFSAPDRPHAVLNRHLRLFWRSDRYGYVAEPPVVNAEYDPIAGTFSFDTPGLGVFQLGYPPDAGEPIERYYAYRAIAGISMGAGAAAYLGMKHHDKFDFILPLGGAVDWPYLLDYIGNRLSGGFCRAGEGDGVGSWCGLPPPTQQFEHTVDYNHWYFSRSGGTFDRSEYVKLFQDLSFAYGAPSLYNPESGYLPPGMPLDEMQRPDGARCAAECRGDDCPPADTFTIAEGFYDDEYNPDGSLPVIAYCDGEDGDPRGDFDGDAAHTRPMEIAYAVDVNFNGRRDLFEPVIRDPSEPFDDFGCDGVASIDEPGYDPITRPDPAGDDYDWYRNPLGTEGNWMFDGANDCGGDGGEPWQDLGLDGVAGTPQFADGGYDYGEGNGQFDYNPNVARFFERTGGLLYLKLPPEERARMRVWTDGGIRDIFNFATAGNHWMGRLQAGGQNVRVYDDFGRILPTSPSAPYFASDRYLDPFGQLGQSIFLRYGDPNLPEEVWRQTNDGEHVGTTVQAVNRFLTMYDWLHNRWEHLHYGPTGSGYGSRSEVVAFQSPRFGKQYRYAITVPPGYDDPANANERYPVVLVLHGYGQGPEDLAATSAFLVDPMTRGYWARSIIVSPDGSCGDSEVYACNDGIDNDHDGMLDAGNDAERRTQCRETADCRGGYICRPQSYPPPGGRVPFYCCPPDWTDCGPPDAPCGLRPENRTEREGPQPTRCADGIDNDQDGQIDADDDGCMGRTDLDDEADCKQGSFYTTHIARRDGQPGGADWEGALLDMLDHIDAHYRTLPPEMVSVPR